MRARKSREHKRANVLEQIKEQRQREAANASMDKNAYWQRSRRESESRYEQEYARKSPTKVRHAAEDDQMVGTSKLDLKSEHPYGARGGGGPTNSRNMTQTSS